MIDEYEFKAKVAGAMQRLSGNVNHTPLEYSPPLSALMGTRVYLKWENEQKTGSFKLRGALNKLRTLTEEQKRRGVISASTGNHGLGLAYAAHVEGVEATIVLPKTAAPDKMNKLRATSSLLVEYEGSCEKAESYARILAQETGKTFISPYNDEEIVFGQGTVGLEIYEDLPEVEDVIVPVGGGGLISGIAGYLKSVRPEIRIVGVEPENSAFMLASLRAGRIIEIEEKETIAEAVAGGIESGSITFPLCQKLVDEIITVEEPLIQKSMVLFFQEHHKIIEGAGVLSLAGLLKRGDFYESRTVVCIVSGGNISPQMFQNIISSA